MTTIDFKKDLDASQHHIVTTSNGQLTNPIPPCIFPTEAISIDIVKGDHIKNIWSQKNNWNPQPYKELIIKLSKCIDRCKTVPSNFIDNGIAKDTPVSQMISSLFNSASVHLTLEESPAYGLLSIRLAGDNPANITIDVNATENDLITIHPDNGEKRTASSHSDLRTTLLESEEQKPLSKNTHVSRYLK